jgi:hypothetical protein
MSVLEFLRGYTLREYAVVLTMATLGGLGLVFMLSSMGGGAGAGETLLKRETVQRKQTSSLRYLEVNAAEQARARAVAARRARIVAERRRIEAQRAARRARLTAARRPARAPRRTSSRPVVSTPTRVVSQTPSRPVSKPAPAPVAKPTPQKSDKGSGGGGGSFDDSG